MNTSKSLAQQLANNIALKAPMRTFRAPAAVAERRRLAVQRFFEDARQHFEERIEAGEVPAPYVLGTANFQTGSEVAGDALEYYRWQDNQPALDSGFGSYWSHFLAWADAHGLDAYWRDDHDGVGQYSWKELHVAPKPHIKADTPVVECKLDLPLEVLERYGSAQAYLAHLERQARAND